MFYPALSHGWKTRTRTQAASDRFEPATNDKLEIDEAKMIVQTLKG